MESFVEELSFRLILIPSVAVSKSYIQKMNLNYEIDHDICIESVDNRISSCDRLALRQEGLRSTNCLSINCEQIVVRAVFIRLRPILKVKLVKIVKLI